MDGYKKQKEKIERERTNFSYFLHMFALFIKVFFSYFAKFITFGRYENELCKNQLICEFDDIECNFNLLDHLDLTVEEKIEYSAKGLKFSNFNTTELDFINFKYEVLENMCVYDLKLRYLQEEYDNELKKLGAQGVYFVNSLEQHYFSEFASSLEKESSLLMMKYSTNFSSLIIDFKSHLFTSLDYKTLNDSKKFIEDFFDKFLKMNLFVSGSINLNDFYLEFKKELKIFKNQIDNCRDFKLKEEELESIKNLEESLKFVNKNIISISGNSYEDYKKLKIEDNTVRVDKINTDEMTLDELKETHVKLEEKLKKSNEELKIKKNVMDKQLEEDKQNYPVYTEKEILEFKKDMPDTSLELYDKNQRLYFFNCNIKEQINKYDFDKSMSFIKETNNIIRDLKTSENNKNDSELINVENLNNSHVKKWCEIKKSENEEKNRKLIEQNEKMIKIMGK